MPTTMRAMPPKLLTHSIQRPLRGSDTDVAARIQNSTPMPSANANSIVAPTTGLP